MRDHSARSGQDVVYLDPSTSAIGTALAESSADPMSDASLMSLISVVYPKPVLLSPRPRVPGLEPGAIRADEDFDEPLPDEFWTGSD